MFDWDPAKWIILILHYLGLVKGLRYAPEKEIQLSKEYMEHKHSHGSVGLEQTTEEEWKGMVWDKSQLEDYLQSRQGSCTILLDGYVLQVGEYMKDHVGHLIVDFHRGQRLMIFVA